MGHEYCGIVEDIGRGVTSIRKGQFVIGSFFASDNTCPHCQSGYQTSCRHRTLVGGAQAPLLRVPLADGTLVATRDVPSADFFPSLLALSDVMGTRLVRSRCGERQAGWNRCGRRGRYGWPPRRATLACRAASSSMARHKRGRGRTRAFRAIGV